MKPRASSMLGKCSPLSSALIKVFWGKKGLSPNSISGVQPSTSVRWMTSQGSKAI